jgi:hypothetical protein
MVINANPDDKDWNAVAIKTDEALRHSFYANSPNRFYSDTSKHDIASAWDMGQVLESTLETASLAPGKESANEFKEDLQALQHYWDGKSKPAGYDSGAGPSGDKYYDDDAWSGIAFMDAYKQNHDSSNLDRAKQIFEFEKFGAQGTDKFAHPGGELWTQQPNNQYRAAVSTAGAAQLGLELYQQTHDKQYLDFATKQFDWVNDTLRAPNGLFYDGIDPNGNLHREQYSYNQGLMLGNATLLYQSTGDPKYLREAQSIADSSLHVYDDKSNYHPENGDPTPDSFSKQPTFFNAVFFKNLTLLDDVAPNPAYRKALADYSTKLSQKLDPANNLVKNSDKYTLLDQSSAVQIFALAHKYPPLDS